MFKQLSGFTLALVGLTVLFCACKKDYESIQSVDAKKIQNYIAKNNLIVVEDSLKTGYYYRILNEGTGTYFKNTDSVLYDGVVKGLESGTTYVTSPVNGNLGTYVGYTNTFFSISMPSVRDVILKLKPGGSASIILPSYLAFGKNGLDAYNIPSNENLEVIITTYNETQADRDDRLIKELIAKEGLTDKFIKDPSGVYYYITTVGTDTVKINQYSSFTATYTGRLRDATVFDSGTDASFTTAGVIAGMRIALLGRTTGTVIRMIIPSALGYGTSASGLIVSNSILDFDVEIKTVTN